MTRRVGRRPPRAGEATPRRQRRFTRAGKFHMGDLMAEHGTRTMYVHYGCRCEACCKAEHQQYLKRKEAQTRRRTYSKWGTDDIPVPVKQDRQRKYNRNRYIQYTHTRPFSQRIRWQDLVGRDGDKCAICGCAIDSKDTWVNENGRKCFGRKYPTVDHIIPLKCGGEDTLGNVQLTCKHCNSAKGAKYEQS